MKIGARRNQAAAALQEWLVKSRLHPGSRLPSERELAVALGTTHYAANRAVARLIENGVLRRDGYKVYYSGPPEEPIQGAVLFLLSATSVRQKAVARVERTLQTGVQKELFESIEELNFLLRRLNLGNTTGVLLEAPFSPEPQKWMHSVDRLVEENIPCVCLGQPMTNVSTVTPDYSIAMVNAYELLHNFGHTELAFLGHPHPTLSVVEAMEAWKWQCTKYQSESSLKRFFAQSRRSLRMDARELVKLLLSDWSEVTGLIIHDRRMAPCVVEEFTRKHRLIPHDLSIVCLGDSDVLKTCDPPLASASFDDVFMIEMAFKLLEWLVRARAATGKLPAPQRLRVEPRLIPRESILSRVDSAPLPEAVRFSPEITSPEQWPDKEEEVEHLLDAINLRPYELTAKVSDARFRTVDISAHLNRPLNFRRGWLGDLPLHNVNPGRQRIHGVLFEIAGGKKRSDLGAIVLRSQKNTTGNSDELPDQVRIRIGCKAQAIYVLHGCGYSTYLQEFAEYRFRSRSGVLGTVPLVTLGPVPGDVQPEEWAAAIRKANLQDWWPDYVQADFPSGRRYVVVHKPMQSYRYLYTLEWINPKPQESVEWLEIHVDKALSATLGVLAVSVLKA